MEEEEEKYLCFKNMHYKIKIVIIIIKFNHFITQLSF